MRCCVVRQFLPLGAGRCTLCVGGFHTNSYAAWFGAGYALPWLQGIHPETGSLHGSAFHSEGWYVMSLASLVLVVVTTLHAVARRWFGLADLALGAMALPVGAAVALAVLLPLGAMNAQIPVAGGLIAHFPAEPAGQGKADDSPPRGRHLSRVFSPPRVRRSTRRGAPVTEQPARGRSFVARPRPSMPVNMPMASSGWRRS